MKIAFDLDQIFINKPPFIPSLLLEKLYKEKDNGELKYRIPGRIDQKLRLLLHFSFFRKPIWENINSLEKLSKNKKLELYLITSRYSFLKNKTLSLIKKYNLEKYFKEIYINTNNEQPHIFKNRILISKKIDMYFDDDLSLLKYIYKNNSNTKLFWMNKSNEITDNITHIQSLKDGLEYIKSL